MGLTVAQMTSLMAPSKVAKGKAPNAVIRNADGQLETAFVKSSQFGKFDSKMGTKRRSRKGRVVTMPNGYARYNGITDTEVVAYQV